MRWRPALLWPLLALAGVAACDPVVIPPESARTTLSDGRSVEVQLPEFQDVLFGANSFRLRVLDDQGRILGTAPQSELLLLSCPAASTCRIVDLKRGRVLELDPAGLVWLPRDAYSRRGFVARPIALAERLDAEVTWAQRNPERTGGLVLFGGLAALLGLSVRHGLRRGRAAAQIGARLAWWGGALLATVLLLAAVGAGGLLASGGYVSLFAWTTSLAAALLLALLVWYLWRNLLRAGSSGAAKAGSEE